MRVGIGYDIHRLKRDRRFILGGVVIPFAKGEDGHSDGDVLAHAVMDALLGACGIADIGELFPPSDPSYKNADSMELLRIVYLRIKQLGYSIVNIDCVIICEKPKVLHFRDEIRSSLSNVLCTSTENIFLKGKTKEGLGCTGKGKAIEAHAVCLVKKELS
ncbi:MAG: 2-C-methyl-D-erythritol 2,4-cyclodiphosphate synthase [Treponema sp.]|nr:2-C-methyl-D-erythritol 2,4-cyclodiphosphate synthase [Treponema sp.]